MVEFLDGSVIAQLSPPSMTFAIQHVLSFPESLPPSSPSLDFARIHSLELRPPDETKFPCLRLARQSLQSGDATPALFNAANTVAVEAFANEQISFTQIPELIEDCLQQHGPVPATGLDHLPALENDLLNYARHRLQILRS
jgi:1-deoxy-D-xylulose-5-phosphate reductoisomerase